VNVFLSYSHSDGEWAREISKELESRGVTTWLDTNISPGESWSESVRDAITRCDAFVAVVGTRPSPAVLTEMGIAFGQGKDILPVYSTESWGSTVDLGSFAAIHTTEATDAADQIVSALSSASGDA
jgi:nucleoside 2-deoxyribosyltransferase